jgi:DNA-directed RNA polymerase specialized sigma24 family protein
VVEAEQIGEATQLGAALEESVMALPPDERLILKMRYYDGLKISEIARLLGRDQGTLYRTVQRLLGRLRSDLVQRGFADPQSLEILGDSAIEFPPLLGPRSVQASPNSP